MMVSKVSWCVDNEVNLVGWIKNFMRFPSKVPERRVFGIGKNKAQIKKGSLQNSQVRFTLTFFQTPSLPPSLQKSQIRLSSG